MALKAQRKKLPNLAVPDIFGVDGYTIGNMVILLWGAPGVGKSTLAHYLAHRAQKTSLREMTAEAPKKARKGSEPELASGLHPVIFLTERQRLHTYVHHHPDTDKRSRGVDTGGYHCPLVRTVISAGGNVTVDKLIAPMRKEAQEALDSGRIPFFIVDSVALLVADDSDRLGLRRAAINDILANFQIGYLILIAQIRDNISSRPSPYSPRYRPSFPDSLLHSVHIKAYMKQAKGDVEITVDVVNVGFLGGKVTIPSEPLRLGSLDAMRIATEGGGKNLPPLSGFEGSPLINGFSEVIVYE